MENKENQNKFQEMQFLEQNLQNLLMQKQAFQMDLSETQNAINEIEKSGDETFKVIGQLMIKSNKDDVIKELKNKEKLIDSRLKSLEKQEESFSNKLESLRKETLGK